jgi:hypothetical protein
MNSIKDYKSNKKSTKLFLFISFLCFIILFFYLNFSRKPFPVKIGQTWIKRQSSIPFIDNHPQDEVQVEYYVKVIDIKDDGAIVYSRGYDTLEVDLENFLFNSELITDK